MEDKLEKAQDHEYTKDGSVDLRGNPILRSKRGGWTACSFIVVYEVFERMTFFGVSSNLVLYLTNRLHQGTVEAANNVTNWTGTVLLLPILGACIADAYLGRYWTFLAGSAIYFLGMCLLTLAVSVSPLKPAPCAASCEPASTLQLGMFFGALYILALGNGGAKPNVSTMGADQFDAFDAGERAHKLSFFNWWMFSIFLGTLFAQTVLVYLQDNVGWAIGYGIPTVGIAVGVAVFLAGTPFYRHKPPRGTPPLTSMARVLVAALRKRRVPVPEDDEELHELDSEVYKEEGRFRIDSTPSLRFLNKAAVKSGPATPWMLSPVTQVEETKRILRLVPILATMFLPCAMIAQTHTLFVKQGATLNHSLGRHFKVPPASLGASMTLPTLLTVALYDRCFVKFARARTGNPRGITLLQRLGAGLLVQIATMAAASLVERARLGAAARGRGALVALQPVPPTIFVLLPQYVLMGVADGFFMAGCMEFFYDQAPESMKSLGSSYFLTAHGVGNFLSSVLLSAVSAVTKRNGGKGWVLNDLNVSHLDYYYGFLTGLCFLNFLLFLFLSKAYTYRAELSKSIDAALMVKEEDDDEDSNLDIVKSYSSLKVCSVTDGCSRESQMRS